VNSEHLSHIVNQPDKITGQDALELEELCRKFPSFPTPFILLAGYYHKTGDYRAEEAIQKAALRVWDRAWLADFVQNKKTEPVVLQETVSNETDEVKTNSEEEANTVNNEKLDESSFQTQITEHIPTSEALEVINVESEVSEDIINETEPDPESLPLPAEQVVLPIENTQLTEVEEDSTGYVEEIISTEILVSESKNTAPAEEISINQETEVFSVSNLFIPEDPEEWVFDEIETLETGNEASILGFTGVEKTENSETRVIHLPEFTADAGGIIQPDVENEAIETLTETFVTETTYISTPAPYQIEQYYPQNQPEISAVPTDFYSWLNNPAANPVEEINNNDELEKAEKNRLQQQSIIDRFIQSDPGVIRPKKEFFTPETAAKKSEHLPENLATETLAKVYLQQGNTDGAIRIYERLMLKFPEKNTYFADLIQKIKNENNP
jgi:hypothetical protein